MASMIVAQLIIISVFKFWPQSIIEPVSFESFDKKAIIVEEMVITKQANAPASPPKPQVPIPVPNDKVIDEIIEFPELDILLNTDPLSIENSTGQTGTDEKISGNPDRSPRVIKIVEPVVPEEAKRAGIKAIIKVNFTVLSDGSVKEAYIAEINLYKENGKDFEVVNDIGYGLLEATIEAAFQWKFRPASERGENVGAYTQDIFTFGF
tara:strand:- start:1657 stop:2280 length:624 start_codon:yes stop_codon:yes gene_type:complete